MRNLSVRCFALIICLLYPLLLSAAEPWVYVTNNRSDTLSIISTSKDEVIVTIGVGRQPHEVAITPDGKRVFVCNAADNSVSVIDANIVVYARHGHELKGCKSPIA